MQSSYPESFEREMGCTQAEWLRWLPDAIGSHQWQHAGTTALVQVGSGALHLAWKAGDPRVIALVRMPRLHVSFRFEDVDGHARAAFMRRFDLYMQRGGG